jgi:uncharacterized protein (TIGR03382 family)
MMVRIRLAALKDIKPREVVLRFLFGGACSVAAYEIAQRFGPVIGGLFLAFPAIFPAGVSLVEKHHRENVQAAGGDGVTEGRLAASMDAAGASIGCIGLMGFALVAWRELPLQPARHVLAESLLAWVVLAAGYWLFRRRRIDLEPVVVLPKL